MKTNTVQLSDSARPVRLALRARFFSQVRSTYAHTLASLTRMGWPQWLTLMFLLGSAVLWIAIWKLDAVGIDIAAKTTALHRQTTIATPASASVNHPLPLAPSEDQYLKDIKTLFKIAKACGVSVGTVDYKREPNAATPIVSRQVELHLTDDYPHMKQFIANVLADLPHAVLQELRIERHDPLNPQAFMVVRFSLIYEVVGSAAMVHP